MIKKVASLAVIFACSNAVLAGNVILDPSKMVNVTPLLDYSLSGLAQDVIFVPVLNQDLGLPVNCIVSAEAVVLDSQVRISASHMLCVTDEGKAIDAKIKADIISANELVCTENVCKLEGEQTWNMKLNQAVELQVQWEVRK
jgi:hypothetical protein